MEIEELQAAAGAAAVGELQKRRYGLHREQQQLRSTVARLRTDAEQARARHRLCEIDLALDVINHEIRGRNS